MSYGSWILGNTWGWLLGLVFVVLLVLVSSPLISGAQFMVGVGIGAGVGIAQARALRPWLTAPRSWALASTAGMGGLFVLHDVVTALGVGAPYSLPAYVVAGAAITGLWQAALLREASSRAGWWTLGSLVGWSVPAAAIAIGDSGAAGGVGDLLATVAILFGGPMVGAASGGILRWSLGD